MSDRYFLDTNIIVYSFDRRSPRKCRTARELIRDALEHGTGTISYQVVHEFANIASRKFASPLSMDEIKGYFLKVLKPICTIYWTVDLFLQGLTISGETGLGIYDSMIISGAQKAGCRFLYSEDLQHKREVGGVLIIDPFK